MLAIQLDHAIIHINDFYIGIAAGDTKVGNLEILQAVSSDNGNYKINDVGADKDQGITLGYANDLFGLDVDVRSKADAALNVNAGVEFNGFIANTNFSVDYASGDLAASTPKKGTIGVKAKISF